jgi:O-antigen ligase
MLWLAMPILKLQVERVIPFDAFAGLVLGAVLIMRFVGPPKQRHRWRLNARPGFYAGLAAMVGAGLLSGLHTVDIEIWGVETLTFFYLALLLATMDAFSSQAVERFVRVGVWTFGVICALCGAVALVKLLGGPRLDWFYEFWRGRFSDKFTGPMRYSNQWAGYIVGFFPLLVALALEEKRAWQRWFLAGCALLGFVTVPAGGSRSGMFLIVAEVVGLLALNLLLSRSEKMFQRILGVVGFGVVMVVGYTLMAGQMEESQIVKRSFGAFELVFEESRFSDDWREENWRSALREFENHPIIGMGLGTFRLYYDRHEIHSTYLSLLAETGLLGLAPYVFLVGLVALALTQSLGLHLAHRKTNAMLLAFFAALVANLLLGIHHNTTRQRHVWALFLIALLYADAAALRLKTTLQALPPAPKRAELTPRARLALSPMALRRAKAKEEAPPLT